ncbi:UPF0280 family protein [Planktotalea sp.]|uniref:UPF0280 family protein n=1 Tax=Planktotalea sp. TaxID=2029877 RepID=UPI00343FE8BC
MMQVQGALLSRGRLHLQHGPIDLVIGVDGARDIAFDGAETRLNTVLAELMNEIDLLRLCDGPAPKGAVARKMWEAAQAHEGFVTPMAGVAGAVAETVLDAMLHTADVKRAYVNNGGDIALHLSGDATFNVAMAGLGGAALGKITLDAQSKVRGIATSGQGGRSLSFGIAESVTVLAETASVADVAATLIAGAVDLSNHRSIRRVSAQDIREDADLGSREVVVSVGELNVQEIDRALQNGVQRARHMQSQGLIQAASLHLRGQSRQIELNSEKVLEHA